MYTSIAPYYDHIFPYNETTYEFLHKYLPNGLIFDVACGTGTYAIALHGKKRTILASDLDSAMIHEATKKKNTKVAFTVADMHTITSDKPAQGIYIIGNSLVHATSIKEVSSIIERFYDMLEQHGTLIIQLVNYQRIISKGITALPLLINDGIKFYREYYQDQHQNLIFQTILEDKKDRIINHVTLLPLQQPQLKKILQDVGFTNQQWFGEFDESPYKKGKSFHAIVVCQKG